MESEAHNEGIKVTKRKKVQLAVLTAGKDWWESLSPS